MCVLLKLLHEDDPRQWALQVQYWTNKRYPAHDGSAATRGKSPCSGPPPPRIEKRCLVAKGALCADDHSQRHDGENQARCSGELMGSLGRRPKYQFTRGDEHE